MTTIVAYAAGLGIGKSHSEKARIAWFAWSLATNLGILFFFKYYNFFAGSLNELAGLAGSPVSLPYSTFLLPVGISFYTFQTVSYCVEVYWGKQQPESHLGRFGLYVSFFPQLVAGPIERPGNLLPQLSLTADFDYGRVRSGLLLMGWGLFKKMVIADNLAAVVDTVYKSPGNYNGPVLAMATILFGYQIYCDFSGYSDIAIGAALVLGVRLMKNFDRPYHAKSLRDFWQRWHISLSTWFRDYLYIPLGGKLVSVSRRYLNLMIVFIISGLWHGASWTFLIWGGLHGAFLVTAHGTKSLRATAVRVLGLEGLPRFHTAIKIAFTFMIVTFAWIFFRAESLHQALCIVSRLPVGWASVLQPMGLYNIFLSLGGSMIVLISLAFLEAVHLVQNRGSVREMITNCPAWIRWPVYSALLWSIIVFGNFGQDEFIYFAF